MVRLNHSDQFYKGCPELSTPRDGHVGFFKMPPPPPPPKKKKKKKKEFTLFLIFWSNWDILMILVSNMVLLGSRNLKRGPVGNHIGDRVIFMTWGCTVEWNAVVSISIVRNILQRNKKNARTEKSSYILGLKREYFDNSWPKWNNYFKSKNSVELIVSFWSMVLKLIQIYFLFI